MDVIYTQRASIRFELGGEQGILLIGNVTLYVYQYINNFSYKVWKTDL